jgi:hypothetical protein
MEEHMRLIALIATIVFAALTAPSSPAFAKARDTCQQEADRLFKGIRGTDQRQAMKKAHIKECRAKTNG